MKIMPVERYKLVKRISREDLDINLLYEFCRLMLINNIEYNEDDKKYLFTHTLAGTNHILEYGSLSGPKNTIKLKIQISIYMDTEMSKDFNIRMNIIKKYMSNSIVYTVLFKDIIDKYHIFDSYIDTDFDLDQVSKLIREVLKLTVKEKIKRWY